MVSQDNIVKSHNIFLTLKYPNISKAVKIYCGCPLNKTPENICPETAEHLGRT
jgi:hypothetical protein